MLKIQWIDGGREPQAKPNPKYPNGIALDLSAGAKLTCETALPYPAKRVGAYSVSCSVCRQKVAVTTAGRPDDPVSVQIACKLAGGKVPN